MASKSLLRYIFRHGPQAKARTATTPPRAEDTTLTMSNKSTPYREVTPSDDELESLLAYNIRSESQDSQRSSVLEDIVEESGSDDDKTSSCETVSPFERNIQALGTHELVIATLYEARIATHAHLDSINATLNLLDALDGFSATITVLKAEFKDRKEMCEEKMNMLEEIERAMERMRFADEDQK